MLKGFAAWTSFNGDDVNWTDQTYGIICPCSRNSIDLFEQLVKVD